MQAIDRIRVGIIGLEAGESWAAQAHIPALRMLPDQFEISGVANRTLESSTRAAKAENIPRPFATVADLVSSADIDLAVITVRVKHHLDAVRSALLAGKHVYCEWPLGNGLAEAEELARLARQKNVCVFIGTQTIAAAEIDMLRCLINDGAIGEVVSSTLVAHTPGWGAVVPQERRYAYLLDAAEGATMLDIAFGHLLSAIRYVLGDLAELSSLLSTRHPIAVAADTGASVANSSPDQILVSGRLCSGAPLSVHMRGGMARRHDGLLWEINGTDGDLRITASTGHINLARLTLEISRGAGRAWQTVDIPPDPLPDPPEGRTVGNVARLWVRIAGDLRNGTQTAPTFDDAVVLHRQIAAIVHANASASRASV